MTSCLVSYLFHEHLVILEGAGRVSYSQSDVKEQCRQAMLWCSSQIPI